MVPGGAFSIDLFIWAPSASQFCFVLFFQTICISFLFCYLNLLSLMVSGVGCRLSDLQVGWFWPPACLSTSSPFFCFVLFLHRSCWTKADLPGGSAGILVWNPIPICPEQTQQKKCLFIHFKPKKKTSVSLKFVEINNDKREKIHHLILA